MRPERHMRLLDGRPGDGTVKIAFATSDRRHVDQHFGSAEGFLIYTVGEERAAPLEAAEFGAFAQDGNEDKLAAKLALLEGCAAVYCQAIGASAIHQLAACDVQPLKVHSPAHRSPRSSATCRRR